MAKNQPAAAKLVKPPAKRQKPRKAAAAEKAGAPPKVRVRMYRQGLGDCFLVTLNVGAMAPADERHMLIDCGTLGAKTTGVDMADVVENIRVTTNEHLHLVVATHEHLDHVSAFRAEAVKDVFRGMTVDHVWMAWTEDPGDELARTLAKNRRDLGQALSAVALSPAAADVGPQVRDLLGFFGDDHLPAGGGDLLGAGKFAETVNEAMEFVRSGLGAKATYHKPGEPPIKPDWAPGFRFYVLGPPRDVGRLGELGGHGSEELYGLGAGVRAAGLRASALAALQGVSVSPDAKGAGVLPAECEREMPFDSRFRVQPHQAWGDFAGYFSAQNEWRAVDREWLRLASDLALQLDSITNNTSLALAIERVADGRVLLFPADAQQGSWLSWHDPALKWSVSDPDGRRRDVTTPELLRRTVFYKVGHHASHNATAKAKGLEMMTTVDELTAFIPVDRMVALGRNPKGSWRMPARALYLALLERCQGRVVRSDIGWAAEVPAGGGAAADAEAEFEGLAPPKQWDAWRKRQKSSNVKLGPKNLFVDYTLV